MLIVFDNFIWFSLMAVCMNKTSSKKVKKKKKLYLFVFEFTNDNA